MIHILSYQNTRVPDIQSSQNYEIYVSKIYKSKEPSDRSHILNFKYSFNQIRIIGHLKVLRKINVCFSINTCPKRQKVNIIQLEKLIRTKEP